jgi:transposase
MHSLDAIINESKDVREVKRALSVKLVLHGIAPTHICAFLNVSPQYVSKWKVQYEAEGAAALLLGYRGSESYLSAEQRSEVERWIRTHQTLTVEQVRDYLEEQYGVVYQSKQS